MNYYPVFIPTLNRYEHFKRCVDSLARNTHADKTDLIIGLDYPPSEKYVEGYNKIKEYLPTISGFKKVILFERPENYGPGRNWNELQRYAFDHYDAVIASEDDNEFSPCFLDYMNKALDFYWDDNRARSVSGYIGPQFYGKLDTPIIHNYDNTAWGLGLWTHKFDEKELSNIKEYREIVDSITKSWKIYKTCPALLLMLLGMLKSGKIWGDVSWSTLNIMNDTYQVRPTLSLVRNTGHDGSGTHNNRIIDSLQNQTISEAKTFNADFSNVTYVNNVAVKKTLFSNQMPNGVMRRIKYLIIVLLSYISFRIKHNHFH